MKTWATVLTCPKRGQYLAQTIASLERGGADAVDERVIFVDGPADHIDGGCFPEWDVVSVSPGAPRGARLAMTEVMRLAWHAGVELLCYFEDDVQICRNAIPAMLEIGVPEPLGLVSYCDLYWHPVKPLELTVFPGCPRDYPVADGGFVGCQALAIPRRTLDTFVTWTVPSWLERDPNNCDGTIGCIASQYGILDSLANHVGQTSAIFPGRTYQNFRAVRGWRGEDFDADEVGRTWILNAPGERCAFHAGVLHPDRRACGASLPEHHELGKRSVE